MILVQSPNPGRDNIGYLLNKAAWTMRRQLSQAVEPHGLTAAQWSVLRDVAEQEKRPPQEREVTPAHIAARLEQDRATLSGILDRLRKRGWITLQPRPEDRRSVKVELTAEAADPIRTGERESARILMTALTGMDNNELDQLGEALRRIINNINGEEPKV